MPSPSPRTPKTVERAGFSSTSPLKLFASPSETEGVKLKPGDQSVASDVLVGIDNIRLLLNCIGDNLLVDGQKWTQQCRNLKWREKSKANRAKSKVKHTTGSTSFAEFEFGLSTCDEEGFVQRPEPGVVWLLEHTRPGTGEGERVWADDVSQQIHEKIVTIEAELSGSGSSPGDLVYPQDVVLRQHHNCRVGRGYGFAPLPSRHYVTALEREKDRVRDHLASLIDKEAEARQRAEKQLEDLWKKHEESERRADEDRRRADEDRRRADEYQRQSDERFLRLMARFTPTE